MGGRDRLFPDGDGLFATDARELFQEFIESLATLQVVKKGLEGDTSAAGDGFTTVNSRSWTMTLSGLVLTATRLRLRRLSHSWVRLLRNLQGDG